MAKQKTLCILDINIYIILSYHTRMEILNICLYLFTRFSVHKVWLPKMVAAELSKKRTHHIQKVFEVISSIVPIEECPIKNRATKETIEKECGLDEGESDAIMQIVEARYLSKESRNRYFILNLKPLFITNDKQAYQCSYVQENAVYWRETIADDILAHLGIPVMK
ncbi:MAG: hypothetical protein GXO48_02415 [Chlorobi bacterium]|nr:hypothetical protein [Chlorobiota bacterium]